VNRFLGAKRLAPMLVSWEIASSITHQSEVEAKRDGAKFIEAEHMLLALANDTDSDAARLLSESGLDHERLASALHEERRRTLAFAGINAADKRLVQATELDCSLSLGTSAKAALKRALIGSRRDRRRARVRSTDLLAGILEAELGTVPRALAIAGVDRAAIIARARNGMTSPAC
jgi:ATP-dependent Clp protease ATP-binding subunit ClpA